MTPAEVLNMAAVAGCEVTLAADGTPRVKGRPNAALMAALREHRAGIVALLGGTPEPEWCGDQPNPSKARPDGVYVCRAWVSEAVDSEVFCAFVRCPFRRRVRGYG